MKAKHFLKLGNNIDIKGDGWVLVFSPQGNQWGFVKFDNEYRITHI